MRAELPVGTVTFLFTDIEGSTRLIETLGEDGYVDALGEHQRVLRTAFAAHGGVEVGTQGDAFLYAFTDPGEGLAAAAAGQEMLASGPVRVRMGLHTGHVRLTREGDDYTGREVHRAARIAATGHGGQVVVSAATQALIDGDLMQLGEHRLKDFDDPVALYQLGSQRFPPLKTISNTNLPRPASSFVGRQREREEVVAMLSNGARLVTLSGPGGSGKTRLAVEAATELVSRFAGGVFWVGLAPLQDATLVLETIAETLGARDGLEEHIGARELLLLLDNLEQVIEAAPELSGLLEGCPNLRLLCTSRELLRVHGEVEYQVLPLASSEAVTLFCERSGLESTADIAELCQRLDDLPLAVELAAARTRVLSPAQILERLSLRLDLLRGGRDADPRQQTLRAAIAWSYDLLAAEEQHLFRTLSVFVGGCSLEAAEGVVKADLDTLQSLVEKSLLRFTDERYWMLETIREYARERLAEAGETDEYGLAHSHYYLGKLQDDEPLLRRGEPPAWLAQEEDNLRAMLDHLVAARPVDAARAAHLLWFFWFAIGAFLEGRQRLREILEQAGVDDELRAMLLEHLAGAEEMLENLDAAEDAARRAVAAAEAAASSDLLAKALNESAWLLARRGRNEESIELIRRAAALARTLDDETSWTMMHDLGALLGEARRGDEAREVFAEAMVLAHGLGGGFRVTSLLIQVGFIDLHERHYEDARKGFAAGLEQNRKIGRYAPDLWGRWGLGYALLGLGRADEARPLFCEALDLILSSPQIVPGHLALIASGVAHSAPVDCADAAVRLRAAVAALRARNGIHDDPRNTDNEALFDQALIDTLGRPGWEGAHSAGAALNLEATIALTSALARRDGEETHIGGLVGGRSPTRGA